MPHTIPSSLSDRQKLLRALIRDTESVIEDGKRTIDLAESVIEDGKRTIDLAAAELSGIDLGIRAFLPDGEDAPAGTPEAAAAERKRRDIRGLTLAAVREVPASTAGELAAHIEATEAGVLKALAYWQTKGEVRSGPHDGKWRPIETPPAAPQTVDDGTDALSIVSENASAQPRGRRPLKNPEPAENRLNSARNFLARCGDMGAGGFQITKYRDEVFAMVANGEAETFEDNSEVRYRLRQPQPGTPE